MRMRMMMVVNICMIVMPLLMMKMKKVISINSYWKVSFRLPSPLVNLGSLFQYCEMDDTLVNLNACYMITSEKSVRGPTKLKRFWKEYDPRNKISLEFNSKGQPCGFK